MTVDAPDPDSGVRLAAFEHLRLLTALHGGALPWAAIADGFDASGRRFLFASQAEGIFRPQGMSGVLSLKTVVPRAGRRTWYEDQAAPDEQVRSPSDLMTYAFRGTKPDAAQNRWLQEAMLWHLPLVYFYGVAPARYEPLFPVYVVGWDAAALRCALAIAPAAERAAELWMPPDMSERRYAMRLAKQRLHQSMFRERVVDAYGGRCALSGFPEPRLLDAAHIVPDVDQELGQPDTRNGILMSRIHHAAYDAGLLGIDPDLRVHVSRRLLDARDGPLLDGFKRLAGSLVRPPGDPRLRPDRQRLEVRFSTFDQG